MPAYHSSFLESNEPVIAGLFTPSFKKGIQSRPNPDNLAEDIIEEAINLFRPNSFSKSFEIRGPADRTLVYLLLYIGDCLGRLRAGMPLSEAQRVLSINAQSGFVLPGEAGFPLNGMFPDPANRAEADQLRQYLCGLRAETAARLLSRAYTEDDPSTPSRWWLAFQRRKFMNTSL